MEAIGEFTGTTEEVKILIANSDLSLRRGEVKQALDMLKTVGADSPHYKAAKVQMADIYLKHIGDRRLYAKCYHDIV
jgi:tetratricopeptide repeat protein 21B